jgi:hypothetical protein
MTEETIFAAALERADSAERAAFLDQACAGEPALRARVEALLRAHTEAGGFLHKPAIQRAAEQLQGPGCAGATRKEPDGGSERPSLDFLAPSANAGCLGRLGHHEVQELIGHGGMGMVLKAFDEKLHRVVAIKVMATPLASGAAACKRFTREARAAAAVQPLLQRDATDSRYRSGWTAAGRWS